MVKHSSKGLILGTDLKQYDICKIIINRPTQPTDPYSNIHRGESDKIGMFIKPYWLFDINPHTYEVIICNLNLPSACPDNNVD